MLLLRRKLRFSSTGLLFLYSCFGIGSALLFSAFILPFRLQFSAWPATSLSDPSYMCSSSAGILESMFPCSLHFSFIVLTFTLFLTTSLLVIPALLFNWKSFIRNFAVFSCCSFVFFLATFTWKNFYYFFWFLD